MYDRFYIDGKCTFKPELNTSKSTTNRNPNSLMTPKPTYPLAENKECTFQPFKALSFLRSAFPEKRK